MGGAPGDGGHGGAGLAAGSPAEVRSRCLSRWRNPERGGRRREYGRLPSGARL